MTALSPGGAGLIDWRSAATGSQARVVKAPGSKQAFLPGIKSGRIAVSIVRCEKLCAFAGTDAAARAPIMTTDLSMRLPLKLPASPLYLKSTPGRLGGPVRARRASPGYWRSRGVVSLHWRLTPVDFWWTIGSLGWHWPSGHQGGHALDGRAFEGHWGPLGPPLGWRNNER
jgi:hypothetical protein